MVSAAEQNSLSEFEQRVLTMASECRTEIVNEFNNILAKNELTFNQLFDTFYIPIANTNPQKFSTQYDKLTDDRLRIVLDKYLAKDERLLYVVATDRNGYVPTHNSRYSKPLTDDADYNASNNRTKRLFNDRTGLAAAKNTEPFLLQKYERDTGEVFYDLSVPVILKEKHWGAVRIGFKK
jgi:methyl-accepting chemotaxis protein